MSEVSELIAVIRDRDVKTASEMQEMRLSITQMNENFAMFYKHIAVADEERKHDAEFKKEVREHIKSAQPILIKAKEVQEFRGKLLLIVAGLFTTGIVGYFYKF
tara:strand:- start:926 stop:1237 length:312 start_codon:yes stop_codon:yes gene_type:complete